MPVLCERLTQNANEDQSVVQPALIDRVTALEEGCSELKELVRQIAQSPMLSNPQQAPSGFRYRGNNSMPRFPVAQQQENRENSHSQGRDPVSPPSGEAPQSSSQTYSQAATSGAASGDGWTDVGPRKRPKIIQGKTEGTGRFKGAPEPVRELFLYRVSKECEKEDIMTAMQENNVDVKDIVLKSKDEAKFRSFKITVNVSAVIKLLSDSYPWPAGVRVRRFFQKRRDAEREKNT